MTLDAYSKSFGRARWFVAAVPFAGHLGGKYIALPFPPMGDNTAPWVLGATAIVGMAALLPYLLPMKRVRHAKRLLVCAAVLFFFHLTLQQMIVVAIHYPTGVTKYVTQGIRRPDLPQRYVKSSDEDLIEAAGQEDTELADVYSAWSLRLNRQMLFWTYTGALGTLQFFLGEVALLDNKRSRVTR